MMMNARHVEARHHGHHVVVDVLPTSRRGRSHIVVVVDDDAPGRQRTDEYITDDADAEHALDTGLRLARALIEDEEAGDQRPH